MRSASVALIAIVLCCADAVALAQANRVKFRREVGEAGQSVLTSFEQPQPPSELPAEAEEIPEPQPETTAGMTLEQLEAIALNHNPTLAATRARIEAARGRWIQVGLPPNPHVAYVAEEIGSSGTVGKQGATIGRAFVTADKLALAREVVGREILKAEQESMAQRLRVLTDVRSLFYRALILQKRLEVTRNLQQVANDAMKATEQLLEAMEARGIDVVGARIEAQRAEIESVKTQNQLREVWRMLVAVTGHPDLVEQPLAGDVDTALPELDWEMSLAKLLEKSPELGAAQAEVQRAQWAIRREQAQVYPNVDVEASLFYDAEVSNTVAGLSVGVPLPIWNRNQGAILEAQANFAAAQSNVIRTEMQLRQRFAEAFRRYEDALIETQKYSQEILPRANRIIQRVTEGFRGGELGYLDLLTAQRTYFRANLDYIAALEQLWASAQYLEGLTLSGSLTHAP